MAHDQRQSSKRGISNCPDVPGALDLVSVLRDTDHLPPPPSPAPHLPVSAKGAWVAGFICWSHLFICHTFSAHDLWPPRRAADASDPPSRFHILRGWFDESRAFAMETSNTPNGSRGSKLHPLTPISGWSYSTETSGPLAEELPSIFLPFRPCQRRLAGWLILNQLLLFIYSPGPLASD